MNVFQLKAILLDKKNKSDMNQGIKTERTENINKHLILQHHWD